MLIDSHCHIPHKKYDKDVPTIIDEAKADGIDKIIVIGTSLSENKQVLRIANNFDDVFCAVGVYPHENLDFPIGEMSKKLKSLINSSEKIVGLGECGIDINNKYKGRDLKSQIELFEMQVNMAKENSLPVIIHNRNADKYIFEVLETVGYDWFRGVFHCFSSGWTIAEKVLEFGFYISFSGTITYPSAGSLIEVVEKVPMNRFILETDAPYLSPQGYRGKINYPKYVKIVAEKVAEIKGISFEEISKASYENTCRLFGLVE